MKNILSEDALLEEILDTVRSRIHMDFFQAEPIKRGWLNLKWKVYTDQGEFLLKQYNKDRLKKYSIPQLKQIFTQQNRLHHLGFPCPEIVSNQGEVFFQSSSGEQFIMMEFFAGQLASPGKLTDEQMYYLGFYTGKMHSLLNDGSLPTKAKPVFLPPTKEERITYWNKVYEEIDQAKNLALLPIIEKQLKLTEAFPLDQLQLDYIGWCHRDLWVDNLLFQNSHLSAILDFDRMDVDHLLLDVGRAVLSGALDDDSLRIDGVKAFVQGYGHFYPTGVRFITDALILVWYLESEWWLDANMDVRQGPPKRFTQEMIWLSEHLLELDEMLEGI
ncbi:phosphotransferase [Ornithinibacillus sp. BX22]|uniref:Phosphotransferase n=1 Tax=Ornithinibacillus hominis TaxID=2763055 RepID=A0A923RK25_9BACI|nr:phosphotransferase [Ornithinibacillus hominis]MBC5638480.1 phosphotransferase [Ornithinibacillus hominis]